MDSESSRCKNTGGFSVTSFFIALSGRESLIYGFFVVTLYATGASEVTSEVVDAIFAAVDLRSTI